MVIKKAVKINTFLIMAVFGLFFLVSKTMAADLTTCSNCHDWTARPNSDVTKFILPVVPDGSATGSIVDKSKCVACHVSYIAPSHQGVALTVQTVYGVTYGAFISRNSLYQPPSYLHEKHNGVAMSKITGPSCAKCHDVTSCTSCHSSVTHQNHYSANPVNPLTGTSIITPELNVSTGYVRNVNGTIYPTWQIPLTCTASECHQTLPDPKIKRTDGKDLCFNCHTTGLAGHDAVAIHATGYVKNPTMDCSQCHKTDLATEHAARTDVSGKAYDCLTCHKSSRADVITAIESGVNTCDGCHMGFDHIAIHPSNVDNYCQKCHKDNLVNEHLYNDVTQSNSLSCETCHKSTSTKVQAAIKSSNTQCTACHTQAHNVNLVGQVPGDIPLYPGYQWSLPQPASIWAGETWMDPSYVDDGQVVISNRRTDVTGQQVWEYYESQLASTGWTMASVKPSRGSNFFKVEYIKDTRKLTIWFYGGENHNMEPVISTGYRIELMYK